jgi:phosphoribosylglycinamide formyltransferase 1
MSVAIHQPIIILISGSGSNMEALIHASHQGRWRQRWGAGVVAVVSNRADAGGLAKAQALGVATDVVVHQAYVSRDAFDHALMACVDAKAAGYSRPPLVLLAGFMRILSPAFVAHYAGRLLNIHPSLLPAFAGLHTHARALEMGCQFAGATVHQVTAELDHGQILAQAVVPVVAGDTPDSLGARVLTQEHLIYPRAVTQWLQSQSPIGAL